MNKLSKEKGVTLIALVITIIVLLILAAVSISALAGQDGILGKAQQAGNDTKAAAAKEKVQLLLADYWSDKYISGADLMTYMGQKQTDGEIDGITDNEDGTYEVEVDGYVVTIDADGKVTKTEKAGPRAEISNIKITLENETNEVTDESQPIGTKLKISFDSVIEGGTIKSITPNIPYLTDGNEMSKTFTIVGTVDGVDYSVDRTVTFENKYEIDESEKIAKVIDKSTTIYASKNSVKEVREGNIPIPVGFDYIKGSQTGGAVISDGTNEFVWVPVASGAYERNKSYAVTNVSSTAYDDDDAESYLPDGITNEKNAVESAGGFYISRYEAGKPDGATNGVTAPISKKGAEVWTSIAYNNGDIKKSAKAMYNNVNVKSSVITGIQWDMTMKFVNNKKDGNGTNYDVTTSKSTRHKAGSVAVAGNNIADKVANIYDLEGNAYEYVAEKNTYNSSSPYVYRGGGYNVSNSASNRLNLSGGAHSDLCFRLALYVAL